VTATTEIYTTYDTLSLHDALPILIQGKEQPDSGVIDIGATVKVSSVDQSREGLENDKTVFDAVANGADILTVGRFEMPSRAYLGRFNFKGGDQGKQVGNLSGGERGDRKSVV
jgi:sulfate-transporting ATPase